MPFFIENVQISLKLPILPPDFTPQMSIFGPKLVWIPSKLFFYISLITLGAIMYHFKRFSAIWTVYFIEIRKKCSFYPRIWPKMGQVGLFSKRKCMKCIQNHPNHFFYLEFWAEIGLCGSSGSIFMKIPILPPDLEQKPLSGKLDVGSL